MGYYTSIDEDYIIENHFKFMAQNILKLRSKYLSEVEIAFSNLH